jgi:hypothetical protein
MSDQFKDFKISEGAKSIAYRNIIAMNKKLEDDPKLKDYVEDHFKKLTDAIVEKSERLGRKLTSGEFFEIAEANGSLTKDQFLRDVKDLESLSRHESS